MKLKNSQTSIKRSHLGQRKSGLIRQVTAWAGLTLHAHQAKHFQFNVRNVPEGMTIFVSPFS
jgi:hypothetical protein